MNVLKALIAVASIGAPDVSRAGDLLVAVAGLRSAGQDRLADMLAAIAAEASWLTAGDNARFMSDFAMQMQP